MNAIAQDAKSEQKGPNVIKSGPGMLSLAVTKCDKMKAKNILGLLLNASADLQPNHANNPLSLNVTPCLLAQNQKILT